MSCRPESEQAEPRKLERPTADRAVRLENRTDPSKLRLQGAVCAFEAVHGTGDAEVMRLAELQHGHVHLHQLRMAGIGKTAVATRVRSGWLQLALPRVYRVGHLRRDPFGPMMAAALYFRGDGLVARKAAAHAWGLLDVTQAPIEGAEIDVLLSTRSGGWVEGVRVHRTKWLTRQDIRWRHGIPVTSPALTILGLAAGMDELDLEAALVAALGANLVRVSQLHDVIERNPRARGVGTLRSLLAQPATLRDTRSRYERKLLRLLKLAALPLPVTNVHVAGKLVDAYWPEFGLVIEIDGWKYHRQRDRFEADRLRDQIVTAAGHHVMRITARQIDHSPYALIARVARAMVNLSGSPAIPY